MAERGARGVAVQCGTLLALGSRMARNDIMRAAGEHVFALFREAAKDGKLVYHGYDRSRELAQATKESAKGSELGEEETLVALLAAWFHDAGYAVAPHADRAESVAVVRKFR